MQVARSADAVVGVAGAAPPVLPCWNSSGPAHKKNGKSHISNRKTVQGCFVVLHTWVFLWFLETSGFAVRSVLSCSWVQSGLGSPLRRYHGPPAFSLPKAFQLSTGLAEQLSARRFQGQPMCPFSSCSLSLSCSRHGAAQALAGL